MSKIRKLDRLMISSSDVRQKIKNNMILINALKSINKNVLINNSDSGKDGEEGKNFLKKRTFTAL